MNDGYMLWYAGSQNAVPCCQSNHATKSGSGSETLTKVTVTIEGNIEEVIATLRGLAGRNSVEQPVDITDTPTDTWPEYTGTNQAEDPVEAARETGTASHGAIWNASYLHTFWRHLSDTARQAMIRVSRSPNHTQKRAQLMHTLQLSQRELSGSLSSQGHSLNRLRRRRGDIDLPRPLTYDKTNDAYVLDPSFAEALHEAGLG